MSALPRSCCCQQAFGTSRDAALAAFHAHALGEHAEIYEQQLRVFMAGTHHGIRDLNQERTLEVVHSRRVRLPVFF